MIIALVLSMIGMIIAFAYFCGIFDNHWVFFVGQLVYVVGFFVASHIWDDTVRRIKKLEDQNKEV